MLGWGQKAKQDLRRCPAAAALLTKCSGTFRLSQCLCMIVLLLWYKAYRAPHCWVRCQTQGPWANLAQHLILCGPQEFAQTIICKTVLHCFTEVPCPYPVPGATRNFQFLYGDVQIHMGMVPKQMSQWQRQGFRRGERCSAVSMMNSSWHSQSCQSTGTHIQRSTGWLGCLITGGSSHGKADWCLHTTALRA